MMTKLSELTAPLKAKLRGSDASFSGVSIDSRSVKPGELFVAIRGDKFDGHQFIDQAKSQGAVAAVVSQEMKANLPLLQVTDTRLALGEMAVLHRQKFHLSFIAHTGSCGKTTVKEMMNSILMQCGEVLATQGTLNNDFGVPLTLLRLNKQHQYAVIEMGANHPGEIAYLTQMVRPQVAFINNIAPAHLEGFGSLEGVARAKAEIFQGLTADGTAIVNADDNFAEWIQNQLAGKKVLRFGIKNKKVDVTAREIKGDSQGYFSFILQTSSDDISVKLPVLGEHNVLNALAAATATQIIGADLAAIKKGLETMQPVSGRLMVRKGIGGVRIFDDTYNANPSSVTAALQALAQYPGERIFVMGDMVELGSKTEEYHRSMGVLAKQLGIQRLYACGPLSREAINAFGSNGYFFESQAELTAAIKKILKPDMVVLVKGSRKMKMENVVKELVSS